MVTIIYQSFWIFTIPLWLFPCCFVYCSPSTTAFHHTPAPSFFLRADSSCRPMPVTGSTFVLLLTWGIIPVGHVYGITGEHMKKSNYTKWDQNYIKLHYPPKKNGQQFNTKHEKFMAFMFAPFFTHTSQAFIRQKLSSLQTFARTATMQVFLGLFETRVRKSNRFSSFPHSNVNFRSTFFRI